MGGFTDLRQDLRYALRGLRRTPGFTVMAVGTLALAIGAVSGMFSVVDRVLLRPLPYAHADRLVDIVGVAPGSEWHGVLGPGAEFLVYYREQSKLLEDLALYNSFTNTFRTPERVERIRMSAPSTTLFSTLGARPILGRLPVPADGDHVVEISYALWRDWFGMDSTVIGRSYEVAGAQRVIIGVMGPEFRFPTDGTMLWIPQDIRDVRAGDFGQWSGGGLVARMRPGVSRAQLADELTRLARQLPRRFGVTAAYARNIAHFQAVPRPLLDAMLGTARRSLWLLLGAVCIVLLIACLNVANLFMVRAEGRHRDLAVRRAIGATRGQLVRLQAFEALVVAALAGALAVALAAATLPLFVHAAPAGISRLDTVHLGAATVGAALFAVALATVACGAVPALRASAPDLLRLREGGRGSTGHRSRLRNGLVVGQTALALVLLIGSGLLVRSFAALRHVDPGYDTSDVFTWQFAPEQPQLKDGPSWAQFHLAFMNRLRALPGVTSVGLVDNVPLDEGTGIGRAHSEESGDDASGGALLHYTFTAGDYFQTMGIRVLSGQLFTSADELSSSNKVIVSRSAAERLWPGEDPIGRRLKLNGVDAWETVIGEVHDVMQNDFRTAPEAVIYFPLVGPTDTSWWVSSPAYVIKTRRAETIAPEVRALVREVAPEAPMYRVFTMAQLAARSTIDLSFTMLTLGVVSALALVLGAVGLYGVLSYVVAERTREIGVRMALGATAAEVRRMVVVQGARVVGAGIAIGVAAALASTRALGGLLYGVAPMDAATFAVMSCGMVAIGALASYLPARRASRVDPVEALRYE